MQKTIFENSICNDKNLQLYLITYILKEMRNSYEIRSIDYW